MIWCVEHQCGNIPNHHSEGWASVPGQSGTCLFAEEFGGGEPCRMVEALLIVKENGEWPDSFANAVGSVDVEFRSAVRSTAVIDAIIRNGRKRLDALASVGREGQ